jgi:hypothetical protein
VGRDRNPPPARPRPNLRLSHVATGPPLLARFAVPRQVWRWRTTRPARRARRARPRRPYAVGQRARSVQPARSPARRGQGQRPARHTSARRLPVPGTASPLPLGRLQHSRGVGLPDTSTAATRPIRASETGADDAAAASVRRPASAPGTPRPTGACARVSRKIVAAPIGAERRFSCSSRGRGHLGGCRSVRRLQTVRLRQSETGELALHSVLSCRCTGQSMDESPGALGRTSRSARKGSCQARSGASWRSALDIARGQSGSGNLKVPIGALTLGVATEPPARCPGTAAIEMATGATPLTWSGRWRRSDHGVGVGTDRAAPG